MLTTYTLNGLFVAYVVTITTLYRRVLIFSYEPLCDREEEFQINMKVVPSLDTPANICENKYNKFKHDYVVQQKGKLD